MYGWTFEITDLLGNSLGQVQSPAERRVRIPHRGLRTAAFRIHMTEDPKTLRQLRAIQTGHVLAKGYWGASLRFHGPLVTYERIADPRYRGMAVTFADPGFNLGARLVGKSPNGTKFTSVDRGQIAKDLIDTTNLESDTGVRTGNRSYLSESITTYTAGPYKPMPEALSDLAETLDGFDWRLIPIPYTSGKIVDWLAAPILGQRRSNMTFEYGGGKHNIASAREVGSRDTTLHRAIHISEFGPGAPGAPVVSSEVVPAPGESMREGLVQAQLTEESMRQALTDEHIHMRAHTRRVVSFEPHVFDSAQPWRVPLYGRDFEEGDWVYAVAKDETGTWLDGWVRVYAIEFNPDRSGTDKIKLTLVEGDEPDAA